MKALVIDTEAWYEDANTNLRSLKRDVGRCMTESASYEKTMWERIETELEEINVENLGFDHSISFWISSQNPLQIYLGQFLIFLRNHFENIS